MESDISGKYTVLFEADKVGELTVSHEGLMTVLDCQCVCAAASVLRLAMLTGNDRKVLGVMMPDGDKLRFRKKYSKNDLRQMGVESIEGCYLITDEQGRAPFAAAKPTAGADENFMIISDPRPEPAALSEPQTEPRQRQDSENTEENTRESGEVSENEFLFKQWAQVSEPAALFEDPELKLASENVTGALQKQLENGHIMLAVPFSSNEPFPLMQIFCLGESMAIQGKNYLVFQLINGQLDG